LSVDKKIVEKNPADSMFKDRKDAGQKLGQALEPYTGCGSVVLGIPRGGVEVGYYVAKHLRLPFSLVVVRKLPFPDNPESGFGAIAEDGSVYFQPASTVIGADVSKRILEEQTQEIQRRIRVLREGKALPQMATKTVILVDDGIAMGSTMFAAIRLCKNQKAAKIIVAAPVGSPSAIRMLAGEVDETVVLEKPPHFRAVAEFYQHWYDVPDEEVIRIMQCPGPGEDKTAGREP
jgi:putative phosphoribosyl transferase